MTDAQLQGGSYEVIRARLLKAATELGRRAEDLNARRKQEFGGQELTVVGNDRVRTENNCVPRDIVSVGKHLLFGFNVFMGLKQERAVGEVFSLHKFERTPEGGFDFSTIPETEGGGFLADRRFVKDFEELCKYYKDTRLLQLKRSESRLLAVFQTGNTERDIKVFRFSLDAAGNATYVDNRGEGDLQKAPAYDFEWFTAGRERQVAGRHPHVNILDEVFVETVGGDLTVKIENNTEDGLGIYREPVEEKDQSLDDAEFHYAKVGSLILLKVKPFREQAYRYLVFNTRTQTVKRADAIGVSCVQLPEEQGVIFPGGYALQTGEVKLFDVGAATGLEYERALKSPNGEDVLYVFHERTGGHYVLLPYNLVRKEVQSPIPCEGYTTFPDGQMVTFRETGGEAQRVHPMQVWQTPFVSADFAAAQKPSGTFLSKIGNAELVRGISEVLTLERMAETETPTRRTWEDLVTACTRAVDAFFWLGNGEVQLLEPVKELSANAELIIDEFEKVLALQRRASEELTRATNAQTDLVSRLSAEDLRSTDAFMDALTALRSQRGRLISLKEIRYMDLARVEGLEKQVVETFENVSKSCVGFLLEPTALKPVVAQIEKTGAEVLKSAGTPQLEPLVKDLERVSAGLDVLGEIVGGLQVGDPTARATILEGISEVFSHLNRVRAQASGRRKELLGKEKRAEFGAQFKLLGQSIESALGTADSPEKCDELLARLQVQLEELEGRFSELDEFASELAKKREELFEAFDARKQTLVDERQRRAQNLFGAADRILQGVARRAKSFKTDDELNSYFAADPMVQKLGDLSRQLLELKDSVKADELDSRLKTARQDAIRALRDKKDLFEDGSNVIKLGPHRFNVNTQPLELTVIPKEGALFAHLTGSDYLQRLDDPSLEGARELWAQTLPSESAEVYRAEFLAAQVGDVEKGRELEAVRAWAASHLDEGYERGIHDADAALILARVNELKASAGLLRYPAKARALATLFWSEWGDAHAREVAHRRAMSLGRLRSAWRSVAEAAALVSEIAREIDAFSDARSPHPARGDGGSLSRLAAEYLTEELAQTHPRFIVSGDAVALRDALRAWLESQGSRADFEGDLRALAAHAQVRFNLAAAWLEAFAEAKAPQLMHAVPEAAALLAVDETAIDRHVSSAPTQARLEGLLGQHPRLKDGVLELKLDDFIGRLTAFIHDRLPRYRAYREHLSSLLHREKKRLRIDELQPKVLSSFVRNRLIDEVYLPLIGTNLAKQLGTAGENKRTDRMGLLLLVSPPGYGKTTLMEYVASRLGLTFVKVNGPALGHDVTSLDPADAPNATARQEVERINFSLELGNNVMLYLDDIQHTNPELLQKFISLCDAQRRIEGVWSGVTRTYDLRGKKFCVVMAGNPYTESGERFRIPDMLANRADTYNLGEILDGKADLFALSYLENALTSNPVLAPLATRPAGDVHKLIKMAKGGEVGNAELEHGYSAVELQEIGAVMQRLFKVQSTLLQVNQQYIASASQDDRFRTEPPFKLQGSYRNMNKLAEKVASAMTDAELETLIDQHYAAESQTLTSAAEVNLLKLAELRGRQSPDQQKRWDELKRGYVRVQTMGGAEDDPATRVSGAIASIGSEVSKMGEAVMKAAAQPRPASEPLGPKLDALAAAVKQASSNGLLEKLDALTKAVTSARDVAVPQKLDALAAAVRDAAPKPLPPPLPPKPYDDAQLLARLDGLAQALREAAPQPVAALAPQTPDLSPILDKLTDAVRAMSTQQGAPPGLAPRGTAAVQKHVALLRERLAPLAAEAKAALAQGQTGQLQAVAVWQRVSEALEVLQAMAGGGEPVPRSRPRPR